MIIDGRQLTTDECRKYIAEIELKPWRASAVCIHNTASPTLEQWASYPIDKRIQNLKRYYEGLGWNSGPHFFVDPNHIIPFTPMNHKGTHSPSFNGTHIGIECVGDYSREDDDLGPGQEVKKNLIALLGMIHERLGLDPAHIAMHKDDPRTTHDCPGRDLYEDRPQIIQMVREWMGHGGEHPAIINLDTPVLPTTKHGRTNIGDLNLRLGASAGTKSLGKLPAALSLIIYNEIMNGNTKWLQVKTPAGVQGWVAARFVTMENDQ